MTNLAGKLGAAALVGALAIPNFADAAESDQTYLMRDRGDIFCRVFSLPGPEFYFEGPEQREVNPNKNVESFLRWIGVFPLKGSKYQDVKKGIFERVFRGMPYHGTSEQDKYLMSVFDTSLMRNSPPYVKESKSGISTQKLNLRYLVGPQVGGCDEIKDKK